MEILGILLSQWIDALPLEKIGAVGAYTLLTLTIVLIFCYRVINSNNKNKSDGKN